MLDEYAILYPDARPGDEFCEFLVASAMSKIGGLCGPDIGIRKMSRREGLDLRLPAPKAVNRSISHWFVQLFSASQCSILDGVCQRLDPSWTQVCIRQNSTVHQGSDTPPG